MAESSKVKAHNVAVEVLDELTQDEERERHRLELRVERAFFEAGAALKKLRDKRLYRSTHKTFEEYCQDRFGYTRRRPYQLIEAAIVFENLCTNGTQNNSLPVGKDILPTSERQVRDLINLEPDEQRLVWRQAVEQAGNKVPNGRIVKGIVESLKQRDSTPLPISYTQGDVVEIRVPSKSALHKHNGCWGIVAHVGSFSCTVHISVRNVNIQCKPDEMELVDPKYIAEIRAVHQRITALMQCGDLSRTAIAVLETLVRQTCFSSDDLWFLEKVEERYVIETFKDRSPAASADHYLQDSTLHVNGSNSEGD